MHKKMSARARGKIKRGHQPLYQPHQRSTHGNQLPQTGDRRKDRSRRLLRLRRRNPWLVGSGQCLGRRDRFTGRARTSGEGGRPNFSTARDRGPRPHLIDSARCRSTAGRITSKRIEHRSSRICRAGARSHSTNRAYSRFILDLRIALNGSTVPTRHPRFGRDVPRNSRKAPGQ